MQIKYFFGIDVSKSALDVTVVVEGKSRVSRMANKNIKQLLHLAAMSSIRAPGEELSEYYQRKVAEGKNKMSVLNAVRNKLILRVFACVY